ncbi:MAG: FmdB family transcriptional regulator [Gemmatimonadetes bacterium]|nr:FmdB family transcriptional regulator [Gemmatimonadota bacterium]
MPTYEYECQSCEHRFDEFQSITAKPLKKCPECGRLKLQRLIGGGAGLIFKGSGFYITDYRSDSYKAGAKADSGKGSDSKDGSKSKSKESGSSKGSGKAD